VIALVNLTIAARNVVRNRRRSTITALAIALGACATLLLGALMSYIVLEFQTSTVRRAGHLAVFAPGFFQYGAGNPAAYGIAHYREVMALIEGDAVLRPLLRVASPMQIVSGVAGNYGANASKTFAGQGVVPADRWRMNSWNQYGVNIPPGGAKPLQAADAAAVGAGIARILHLCEAGTIPGCPKNAAPSPGGPPAAPAGGAPPPPPQPREL
jgi:putative ABC transport system permease protein